jgi:tetratricopeptide (TPR) repeat protein
MRSLLRIAFALAAFGPALGAMAQGEPLVDALRWFQAGQLDSARFAIDRAIAAPATARDPEAWLLRGFVYKDLFKAAPTAEADTIRAEAMSSLLTCLELDQGGVYRENAEQAYDFLARTIFNDAARALNAEQPEEAVALYGRHRAAMLRLDPAISLNARDVEFNNALGSVYNNMYVRDRSRVDLFDKATAAFAASLALDPDNYGANYNTATLHYNRAVHAIRSVSASDDLPTLQRVQEVSREFFLLALPYMQRAHELNPNRPETLLGLENIYYSLGDDQRTDEFRRRYEQIVPMEPER